MNRMLALAQLLFSIIGAILIGSALHNPILGLGIWLITWCLMPQTTKG